MTDKQTWGVHLFHDDTLIANLQSGKGLPEPEYVVEGTGYVTVGYVSVIEIDRSPSLRRAGHQRLSRSTP